MTLRRLLFLVVLANALIINPVRSQTEDTITVSFDCGQVVLGQQICVPILVDNFTDITTFSIPVTWDPTVLQFVTIQNEAFSSGTGWFAPGPSDLRYIWGESMGLGVNLPDGTALFEICFRAIGAPGSTSIVTTPLFVLNPFNPTEFGNPDAEAVPFVIEPCTVDVINPNTVVGILSSCGSPDGVAPGSFTITAAGGNPPYTYMWSGPSSGSGALAGVGSSATESVGPGNYSVTLTDNTGANQIYMVTVAANTMMPVITIVRQVTCFNFTNGRIEVGTLGGAHPISVIWNNTDNASYAGSGYIQTSADVLLLNSLPVGNYAITLIDANGCTTQEMVLLAADPIVIDAIPSNATCIGTTDGSVSLSFSGGHPFNGGIYNLSNSWGSGGSIMTTSPLSTAPILGPGDYWVQVCDSINGCCARDTFTVEPDTDIGANFVPEPPLCAGQNNGRLQVIGLTNGANTGFYDIQLFNSNHLPVGGPLMGVAAAQYTNLAPGTYFVVVQVGMCRSDTLMAVVPIATPVQVTLVNVKPSGCISGQGSGMITVSAMGGAGGYNYSWDGGAFNGAMISGVPSGNHTVTVTDANGCTSMLSVNVPQATGPVISDIIASNIGCSGGDATLEVIFTEGSSPVTVIDWSTGDSTALITGVQPGMVTVLVRDSLFCFDIASFDVPATTVVQIDSVRLENPTCIGDADGQFTVFASLGLQPYTYVWSTGDTTNFNLLAGLTAGSYSVTVLDADTCMIVVDTTVMLEDPEEIQFQFDNTVITSCSDACDGEATLTPSGGIVGLPYSFFWDAGLNESGMQSIATGLCPGYQRVIVSQDNLCFYEDSVFIDSPQPVGLDTVAFSNVSCFGLADGMITVMGTGGTGPFTYNWDILPSGPTQAPLDTGMYQVTVTDINGCTFLHTIEIVQPDSLSLAIDSSLFYPVSCNSANSGIITLMASGGNGGFTYVWDPSVSTGSSAANVPSGVYHVTVTDDAGCTDTTSIVLTGPAPVIGFLPMIEDPLCFGGLTLVTVDSAFGGNGGFTWSVNGGQPHALGEIVELPAGIYNIVTQDSTDCRDTTQILLNNPPPLELIVTPEDPIVDLGDSISLQVFIQGALVPIDSVVWMNNGPLSCYDCTSPTAMNVVPTVYTVTVWDENGCTAMLDVLVDVDNRREVFIPNIFSPNFDGRNDQLLLHVGQGITGIPGIRLFDRWGEVMVDLKDVVPVSGGMAIWDGSYRGKMMPPGVYVYFIEVEFANGEILHYRGDVTLVR